MREIGKADKGARGDAQQLADDAVGPLGRLERLRQDRIIKGVAGIIDEVAVRIALHDGLTARDRRGGIGGVAQIGKASCRERVCKDVKRSVAADSLKKKK